MVEFRRKRNRLAPEAYQGREAYFVTACSEGRRRIFESSELVQVLLTELRTACHECCFGVYAYCFMPDHLHLIVVGLGGSAKLAGLMRAFKGRASVAARRMGVRELWQKGFYDHILRSGREMDEAAWYMFLNPVRAQLAARAEDWPYSGSWMFEWRAGARPEKEFVPPWKRGAIQREEKSKMTT